MISCLYAFPEHRYVEYNISEHYHMLSRSVSTPRKDEAFSFETVFNEEMYYDYRFHQKTNTVFNYLDSETEHDTSYDLFDIVCSKRYDR